VDQTPNLCGRDGYVCRRRPSRARTGKPQGTPDPTHALPMHVTFSTGAAGRAGLSGREAPAVGLAVARAAALDNPPAFWSFAASASATAAVLPSAPLRLLVRSSCASGGGTMTATVRAGSKAIRWRLGYADRSAPCLLRWERQPARGTCRVSCKGMGSAEMVQGVVLRYRPCNARIRPRHGAGQQAAEGARAGELSH